MEESTLWWILTGITIAAELLTGGIYLLMIALGMAAGAVAAHLGLHVSIHISTAAIVGVLSVMLCRRIRGRRMPELPAAANPDLNLDIGETVHVPEWNSDGTARIADAVGAVGTVYVTVPPALATGGQVTVSFKGRQETYEALQSGRAALASGAKVRVKELVDSRTLLVEPLVG